MSPRPPSPEARLRVAVVGVGRMGLGLCARLAAAGPRFEVSATDVAADRVQQAVALGARGARSIADAASGAQFLISSLPGSDEVLAVIDEVTGSLPRGGCWIETSSAKPAVARAIADAAHPRRVQTLDAPVGGGPEAARSGALLVFAGGELETLERCRPVLDVLSERIVHTGQTGTGYATKLLANALWFTHAVAGAEALTLGRRFGLDLEVLLDALGQSAADSTFLSASGGRLLDGDDLATFSIAACSEELAAVGELGIELGVPLDVLGAVGELYRAAAERYDGADGELLAARLVAERAGVTLTRSRAT